MNTWLQFGNAYKLSPPSNQQNVLPPGVFRPVLTQTGYHLELIEENFSLPQKVYGAETDFINRVGETWRNSEGNLGILLSGRQGTGKSITAKIIGNVSKLPIILVSNNLPGQCDFISDIDQEVIVMLDEFEKVFKPNESTEILTLMDGGASGRNRRLFILTVNQTNVNENLIQRPGRIRYHKRFNNLSPAAITEIVDDRLKHKKWREEIIKVISTLEIITIDIVTSLVDEINIHNDDPMEWVKYFNVKRNQTKFNIYKIEPNPETGRLARVLIHQAVDIAQPIPFNEDRDEMREWFIAGKAIGQIQEVISDDTILVGLYKVLTEEERKKLEDDPFRDSEIVGEVTIQVEPYYSISRAYEIAKAL